eukprot:2174308-Rhodomonas_salina.1
MGSMLCACHAIPCTDMGTILRPYALPGTTLHHSTHHGEINGISGTKCTDEKVFAFDSASARSGPATRTAQADEPLARYLRGRRF